MTIKEIISITENRLSTLNSQVTTLESLGDVDGAMSVKVEISDTEITLEQLRSI